MSLTSLPPELLVCILELVLDQRPRHPITLLLVNSTFRGSCLSILHSELRFSSVRQIDSFIRTCNHLLVHPKSISISLAGGTADFRLFKLFRDLILRISTIVPKSVIELEPHNAHHFLCSKGKLGLRRIQLCLNSHMGDINLHFLSKALDLTDPEEFIWTGPDPAHHFSTAILPIAATYLFRTIGSWSSLRHLKLTNLSFPLATEGRPIHPLAEALGVLDTGLADGLVDGLLHTSRFEGGNVSRSSVPMPCLQSIYLGQITFLDPTEIARIAGAPELISLTSVRVIDAYQGSIWGPRVRKTDVERAAMILFIRHADSRKHADRVKAVVSCEALTERIMGGDRMDHDN